MSIVDGARKAFKRNKYIIYKRIYKKKLQIEITKD